MFSFAGLTNRVVVRRQAAAHKLAQKKLRELTSPPAKQMAQVKPTAPTPNGSNEKMAPKASMAQRRALALERVRLID
jgi:hypothetical protein